MRLSLDQLRHELETDPTGLGYRVVGKWLTAAQIGHLLVSKKTTCVIDEATGRVRTTESPGRLEELCDGGHLCLKTIARITYGRDWVTEMLRHGEITFHEVQVLAAKGKISAGVLKAAKALHEAREQEGVKRSASHADVDFTADPYDPEADGQTPPDPFGGPRS